MAKWDLKFTLESERDLARLDKPSRKRIIEKLDWLQTNFGQITPLPLGDDWQGFFKLRVGNWRIIYEIIQEEKIIKIWIIDHRDKIYKRRK